MISIKNVKVKNKYKTNEEWSTSNIILAKGEFGIESDTNRVKIGNGVNGWNDLSYSNNLIDSEPIENSLNPISSGFIFNLQNKLSSVLNILDPIKKIGFNPDDKLQNLNSILTNIVSTCSGEYYFNQSKILFDVLLQKNNLYLKRSFDSTFRVVPLTNIEEDTNGIVDLISVYCTSKNNVSKIFIANKHGKVYFTVLNDENNYSWSEYSLSRDIKSFYIKEDESFFIAITTNNEILYGSSFENYELAESNNLSLYNIKNCSLYPIIMCENGYCFLKNNIWKYVQPPFDNIKDITIGLHEEILVLCNNQYHIGQYKSATETYEWTSYSLTDTSIYTCLYHNQFILVGKTGIYISLNGKSFEKIDFKFKPINENVVFTKAELDTDGKTLFLYNDTVIAYIRIKESDDIVYSENIYVTINYVNEIKSQLESKILELEQRINQLEK